MAHHAHTDTHAHGDSHYVKIWATLCGLLVVSVVGPMLEIKVVTLVTAFGIAIVKAYLVAKHFMHLSIEKKWVTYILVAMVAFMVVYFAGTAPDVLRHEGYHWSKDYVEPAPVGEGHVGQH